MSYPNQIYKTKSFNPTYKTKSIKPILRKPNLQITYPQIPAWAEFCPALPQLVNSQRWLQNWAWLILYIILVHFIPMLHKFPWHLCLLCLCLGCDNIFASQSPLLWLLLWVMIGYAHRNISQAFMFQLQWTEAKKTYGLGSKIKLIIINECQ